MATPHYPAPIPPTPPAPKPPGKGSRVVAGISGFMITLFTLPCMAVGLGQMIERGVTGGDIGVLLFLAMLTVPGALLLRHAFKKPAQLPAMPAPQLERMVLELARRSGGELSVPQLAVEGNLSIEESKRVLEDMREREIASVWVGENGSTVYQFLAFQKRQTREEVEESEFDAFDRELAAAMESQGVAFDFDETSGASSSASQEQHHPYYQHNKPKY